MKNDILERAFAQAAARRRTKDERDARRADAEAKEIEREWAKEKDDLLLEQARRREQFIANTIDHLRSIHAQPASTPMGGAKGNAYQKEELVQRAEERVDARFREERQWLDERYGVRLRALRDTSDEKRRDSTADEANVEPRRINLEIKGQFKAVSSRIDEQDRDGGRDR